MHRIKIAHHARFDEAMTDLDFSDLPPNIRHLHRVQQGDPLDLPPDDHIESPECLDFDQS
jgi:hypothetical protein